MVPVSSPVPETIALWKQALDTIRARLGEPIFKIWIEPLSVVKQEEQTICLAVPDRFFGEWLQKYYGQAIREALEDVLGSTADVQYVVQEPSPLLQVSAPARAVIPHGFDLNPKYTFETFVVGTGNRFAYAAATAVSASPAKMYNPLLIYGAVGLGKTHLMQAIAQAILRRDSSKKLLYLTSETFTNELIAAIQHRSQPNFRARFRTVDVLLVDDIHFIGGKEATQEEFFHTFNALYDAHRQIILTSARPPRDIPGLELRLVSRFGWGLVTDIEPPDYETRVAILQRKLPADAPPLTEDVIHYMAKKIKSNIRELEGALVRVIAYASLHGVPLTLELVKDLLKDAFQQETSRLTVESIQRRVADHFGLKLSDMRGKSRSRKVVYARQLAMYLARELTSSSLSEVGGHFGGRNHATVIHAHKKISAGQEKEPSLKGTLSELIEGFLVS